MLKQTQMWCGDVCSQHHRLLPAAPTSSPPPLSLSLYSIDGSGSDERNENIIGSCPDQL